MYIRWSDNDHHLGPFTYARDRRGYQPLAVVLGSGDDDDYPGCRLRLSGFGHTFIVALPAVLKPAREHVLLTDKYQRVTDIADATRDYWETHDRQYGFSYSEGFLQVFLGRQTHDSSTTQDWCKHLPWTQWRFVRFSLYGLSGEHVHTDERPAKWGTPAADRNDAARDACPTITFAFADFDGEQLTATTMLQEREWRFGEGWFKWLSLFRRPKVRRSLDIRFSGETGARKGSWKGGTIGHSIDAGPGERHESAFRRYCAEHRMTFMGLAA